MLSNYKELTTLLCDLTPTMTLYFSPLYLTQTSVAQRGPGTTNDHTAEPGLGSTTQGPIPSPKAPHKMSLPTRGLKFCQEQEVCEVPLGCWAPGGLRRQEGGAALLLLLRSRGTTQAGHGRVAGLGKLPASPHWCLH